MIDYGKVAHFMSTKGVAWNAPGPQGKKPAAVPATWDAANPSAWDVAMLRDGFDATVCDEARWVYSFAPTDNRMGITLIVYFEEGQWFVDFCLDTLATENNADWDMGIEAPAHCTTPLMAAEWAKAHVRGLLATALEVLK